jgi:prophage regulatory protein
MREHLNYEWARLRLPDVCAVTGLGKSTVWRMVKEGRFPTPHSISARVTAWKAADVKAWLESKAEGQNHAV